MLGKSRFCDHPVDHELVGIDEAQNSIYESFWSSVAKIRVGHLPMTNLRPVHKRNLDGFK